MSRGGRQNRRRVVRWWRDVGGCYCGKHEIDWKLKEKGLVIIACPHSQMMLGPVWKKAASNV